jgi:hypothetical protein
LPIIVEVLGVSGAGKSTLARRLKESLSAKGFQVVLSRHGVQQNIRLIDRLQGSATAVIDIVRLAKYFFRSADSTRYVLVTGTLLRLARAAKHARHRRILARGLPQKTVILQEPGWPMQLLGHHQFSRQPLKEREACEFLTSAPHADILVVLENSAAVSLSRLRGRRRGAPRLMRGLSEPELAEAIRRGARASHILADAARSLGIETYQIDVSCLDENEASARVYRLVVPAILAQLNRSRP